jgi:hypothetical protein
LLSYSLSRSPVNPDDLPGFGFGLPSSPFVPVPLDFALPCTYCHEQKRMHDDRVYNPQLNHAHSYVYTGNTRGMCLDLEWHETAKEDLTEEDLRENYVEEVEVGDLEGDVFRGFEDAWFDEGGRIGGW